MTHRNVHKIKEIFRTLASSITPEPDDGESCLQRGLQYIRERKLDRALEELTRAAELLPESHLPYMHIGWVYFERREYEEAAEAFSKSLAIKVTAEALVKRATSYGRLERNQEARSDLMTAMRMDKSDPEVSRACGLYHQWDGNYERAVEYYDDLLARGENERAVYYYKADCLAELGRTEEAIATLEHYLPLIHPMDTKWRSEVKARIRELKREKTD